jgi:hypothetical protein
MSQQHRKVHTSAAERVRGGTKHASTFFEPLAPDDVAVQRCHSHTSFSPSPFRFMYSNILREHVCLPFYSLSFTPLAFFPSSVLEKTKTNMIACLLLLHYIMDFNITSGGRNSVQETYTTLALLWPPAKADEHILGRHQSIRGTHDPSRSTKFHIYDRSSPSSANTRGASWSTRHVDMTRSGCDSSVASSWPGL